MVREILELLNVPVNAAIAIRTFVDAALQRPVVVGRRAKEAA
jgi:hypothetical protein